MKAFINFFTGTLLTGIVYFLGGWDFALQALLVMIVLDYITGICKAVINKQLDSLIGIRGIAKKVGYLILVAVSVIADKITGDSGAIRNVVIYGFVCNEGLSILENWGAMGLKLPSIVAETLQKLNKE